MRCVLGWLSPPSKDFFAPLTERVEPQTSLTFPDCILRVDDHLPFDIRRLVLQKHSPINNRVGGQTGYTTLAVPLTVPLTV